MSAAGDTPRSARSRHCFVCAYASSRCDRAEVSGRLVSMTPELQGASLKLELATGNQVELTLRSPWHRLVGDLERHDVELANQERGLTLAAYHLAAEASPDRWRAGSESLVVLEPEWLEDVTSLTRTQYCERHYLIAKFHPDQANEATLKGNLAHEVFRQIVTSPNDNRLLQQSLVGALRSHAITLAALGVDPEEARATALPALRQLVRWARSRAPDGPVRSETLLLAHRLGMRGRIDAAWEEAGRVATLAELKTGSTRNGRARPEHELQVGAYGLMLAERGEADLRQERLLLLYAENTDERGQPDLERQVPFRASTFANLVHFRNRLVLIDLTGRATYQRPNRCRPCRSKQDCHRLTELLEAPRCATGCVLEKGCTGGRSFDDVERAFFRHWAAQLDAEWRALNDATARLWRTAPEERCADGSAAIVLAIESDPSALHGKHVYRLALANDCEIRQGDRVLLSDADGPMAGTVAQVEVVESTGRELWVQAGEPLRFRPHWVDQYASDRLFLRSYAGLYGWLSEPRERRLLVIERRAPRFGDGPALDGRAASSPFFPRSSGDLQLNQRQREAVELALRAQDYLLVQGPPGTGKTAVVAALARELVERRRRVLLLAGTNRALDRLMSACTRLGLEESMIRLGSRAEPGSAAERRLLSRLVDDRLASRTKPDGEADVGEADALGAAISVARELLFDSPIVAATIATLASGPFAALRGTFDTVALDEASQVTLPAALGVLGYGKRFVLVGDHRQLPPVVHSAAPGSGGLTQSLFEYLVDGLRDGQPGLVLLEEQYRMNAEICAFPSQTWYAGRLRPAERVAGLRLVLPSVVGHGTSRQVAATAASGARLGSTGAEQSWETSLTIAQRLLDPDRPVVFVDIPGSASNASRVNRREAVIARSILEAALLAGLTADDVAVIAPFRAQVARIRAELSGAAVPELRSRAHDVVDTVDRFQGSERQLVVYSFASFAPRLHPLMLDPRRLNVALTRAQRKLILLGDLQILRAEPCFAALESYCRGLFSDGSGVVLLSGE